MKKLLCRLFNLIEKPKEEKVKKEFKSTHYVYGNW